MRVVICGGGLQGLELCFLAKKAGWEICLIDKNANCPASKLADIFLIFDFRELEKFTYSDLSQKIKENFELADIIVPATENILALKIINQFCKKNNFIFAFDEVAYAISSSKLASRELFLQCNTPIPKPFLNQNDFEFPMIAKPSGGSGSRGVQIFYNIDEFYANFPEGLNTPDFIFESYCAGPSYSVEVCGSFGEYKSYTVTALTMDIYFDCNGVIVPSGLDKSIELALADEAIKLAKALNLQGLMDLEVIMTADGYKVLEIDARFPSQTPSAVYLASNINLFEELVTAFIDYSPKSNFYESKAVFYAHALFTTEKTSLLGEHIMSEHGAVTLSEIKSYPLLFAKDKDSLAVTLMLSENKPNSFEDLQNIFQDCLKQLENSFAEKGIF